jgi:hypothetical protein
MCPLKVQALINAAEQLNNADLQKLCQQLECNCVSCIGEADGALELIVSPIAIVPGTTTEGRIPYCQAENV